MKKFLYVLFLLMTATLFCMTAVAEGELPVAEITEATVTADLPTEPFTWEYLATIAGATLATLLIVQLLKLPLDKVWKIPTRIIVYAIALIIMVVATYFTTGLDWSKFGLSVINAVIVALAAMGAYEVTFAKLKKAKQE